jgi:hypothetical protein
MKIYTKFGLQSTINDFIKELFSSWNGNYMLNVETYSDPDCTQIQCYKNKYRSFDDVFDCINTYYPDTPPEKVMHELLVADIKKPDEEQMYLHIGTCSGIQRIRMLYVKKSNRSYGLDLNKYNSKWSWRELFDKLELKTAEQIKEYIEKHLK